MQNLIVGAIAGVAAEEVILDAHIGDDGHGDLDVAALERGWNEIEAGQGESEEEAEGCRGERGLQ